MLKRTLAFDKNAVAEFVRQLQPEVLKSLMPSIGALLNQHVGILCLSEVADSILMWGHYTADHRGFVIGFDSDHAFFTKRRSELDEFGFLRQVDYQQKRPRVVLYDTSSPAWFNTKSEQWAYEREWRVLRLLSESDFRKENSPFPLCLFRFPEEAVQEIIIGLRSTTPTAQRLESIARGFSRAKLLRACENPTDYSLILRTVC
jgi:hypothetical protein